MRTQLYRAIHSYKGLYIAIQGETQLYRAIHSDTGLYTAIQGYTYMTYLPLFSIAPLNSLQAPSVTIWRDMQSIPG